MIRSFLIVLLGFFFSVSCFGQGTRIDSLLQLLERDQADTSRLIHLYQISDEYETVGNYAEGLKYGKKGLELADAILANPVIQKNERLSILVKKCKASIYSNIGIIYSDQGNYPEALKNYFDALRIKEGIGDKAGVASSYNNIGIIYDEQGNYNDALKNHFASLKIKEELGDKKGIGRSYNNIGNVYYALHNYAEALKSFTVSLRIKEETNDLAGTASAYNNIGNVYYDKALLEKDATIKKDKLDRALENYLIAIKIKEKGEDKASIASSYNNLGNVFTQQKKFGEAEEYLLKAKKISEEIGHVEYLRDAHKGMMKLASGRGDYKSAYNNHKLYILYRDSIDNQQSREKTIQNQLNYDFEKKEAVAAAEHKKELQNQQQLAEEKGRKQRMIILFVVCGLLLMLIFAGLILRSLRVTRRQKTIIEQQKDLVEEQKKQVERQKMIVEEHQKEIIDSITYARRIQHSQLPTEKYIDRSLKRLNK